MLKQQNQLKQLRTRCERIRSDRQIELEAERLAGLQQRLKRAIIGRLEAAEQEQLRLKERSCQKLKILCSKGFLALTDGYSLAIAFGEQG